MAVLGRGFVSNSRCAGCQISCVEKWARPVYRDCKVLFVREILITG